MGYAVQHKRMKPKKVKPTERQKMYHLSVMEQPCMNCGAFPTVAHHPLMESPLQVGRRDHEFVVPVCDDCHREIHDVFGNEQRWAHANHCELPVRYAEFLRLEAIAEGRL